MAQSLNWYKADLREFRFLLFEQFRLQDLLGKGRFADWSREDVEMVIEGVYKWSCEVLGPLNQVGDQQGCTLKDGKVTAPEGFPEAWKSLYEAGWRGLSAPEEYGGQSGPFALHNVAEEIMAGSNTAFNMYPGLTHGVAEVVGEFGTPEQKKTFCKKLYDGTYGGTMCLTEPQAGSDVGAGTTRAIPQDDGTYHIEGTKIYISGGDHDMTENIIHLVLARTPGAPSGTKGLSLFLVPRDRLDGSGSNHVVVAGLEHKMGIRANATCTLNLGEGGPCVGHLVGTEEQRGIRQMFRLMNYARIAVGVLGVAVSGAAYQNALAYAKERKQGANIKEWKNPDAPRVPIIQHADVRRMLLDMKSKVEGMRALVIKLTMHGDKALSIGDSDPQAAAYHQGQVDLLVPLAKAYCTDQAFELSSTAMQIMGGAGYLQDHPIEQYCRDSRIFPIYEGTNHIQALDLVGRKLGQKGGANFMAFMKDLQGFAGKHREHATLGDCMQNLDAAAKALQTSAMKFLQWSTTGKMEMVPREANRFLEMMSETTVAWLLLDAAVLAEESAAKLADGHADKSFYEGRVYSALYYARNVLPLVPVKGQLLQAGERSVLDIPEAAFATL